jgi:hypothetical protein
MPGSKEALGPRVNVGVWHARVPAQRDQMRAGRNTTYSLVFSVCVCVFVNLVSNHQQDDFDVDPS